MAFSIFATLDRWKLNPRRWPTRFLEADAAAGARAPTDTLVLPTHPASKGRLSDSVPSHAGPVAARQASPEHLPTHASHPQFTTAPLNSFRQPIPHQPLIVAPP